MHKKLHQAMGFLLVGAALAWPMAALAGRSVFVNTRYAKLRAGKTSSAAEVAKLAYGQELSVVGEAPGFLEVKTAAGQAGFIAKQWTADTMPSRSSVAEGLGAAARGGGNPGVAYTAGARGLAPEAEQYAQAKGDFAAAVAAVKEMERFALPDAKVEAFLRDGRLGEFSDTKAAYRLRATGVCAAAAKPMCWTRGAQ